MRTTLQKATRKWNSRCLTTLRTPWSQKRWLWLSIIDYKTSQNLCVKLWKESKPCVINFNSGNLSPNCLFNGHEAARNIERPLFARIVLSLLQFLPRWAKAGVANVFPSQLFFTTQNFAWSFAVPIYAPGRPPVDMEALFGRVCKREVWSILLQCLLCLAIYYFCFVGFELFENAMNALAHHLITRSEKLCHEVSTQDPCVPNCIIPNEKSGRRFSEHFNNVIRPVIWKAQFGASQALSSPKGK